MDGILGSLGIDPFYLFIIMFMLQVALIVLLVLLYEKYNRLQKSYSVFMKGKNGKSLEKSIFKRFEKLEEIYEMVEENKNEIGKIYKKMESHYQKVGIVKYDAFHEMGGNLSLVLTILNKNTNESIFNPMQSREASYTYIKEIVKGASYIALGEEERQCLEKAIYQESYDIKDTESNN